MVLKASPQNAPLLLLLQLAPLLLLLELEVAGAARASGAAGPGRAAGAAGAAGATGGAGDDISWPFKSRVMFLMISALPIHCMCLSRPSPV